MSNKIKYCTNLKKLLSVECEIIKRHIDDHKWFNAIADKETAICDFIEKYAWLMREVYCGSVCEKRYECECAEEFIIDFNEKKS